ncbi:hypothetical protein [Acidiplasma cupricumulans]|uniref:hypothetical protein n=1 Tax=Acidiplasma cupricumulans TaxID=312540 RepID=UPI00158575A1|nr:hypothetical protein [Acidiplasma cupricumulans]
MEKIEMAYNDPYFSGLPKGSLERFYLDQVFTSAAVVKHPRDKILLLDSNYNYSLPVMKHIDQNSKLLYIFIIIICFFIEGL